MQARSAITREGPSPFSSQIATAFHKSWFLHATKASPNFVKDSSGSIASRVDNGSRIYKAPAFPFTATLSSSSRTNWSATIPRQFSHPSRQMRHGLHSPSPLTNLIKNTSMCPPTCCSCCQTDKCHSWIRKCCYPTTIQTDSLARSDFVKHCERSYSRRLASTSGRTSFARS